MHLTLDRSPRHPAIIPRWWQAYCLIFNPSGHSYEIVTRRPRDTIPAGYARFTIISSRYNVEIITFSDLRAIQAILEPAAQRRDAAAIDAAIDAVRARFPTTRAIAAEALVGNNLAGVWPSTYCLEDAAAALKAVAERDRVRVVGDLRQALLALVNRNAAHGRKLAAVHAQALTHAGLWRPESLEKLVNSA